MEPDKRSLLPQDRPTFRQLAGSDGDGWECPRCGCHDWRVVDSRQFGTERRRVRACRHCHQSIRTVEILASDAIDRNSDDENRDGSTGSLTPLGLISDDVNHDDAREHFGSHRAKRARA